MVNENLIKIWMKNQTWIKKSNVDGNSKKGR
jgi:hypothetical protein